MDTRVSWFNLPGFVMVLAGCAVLTIGNHFLFHDSCARGYVNLAGLALQTSVAALVHGKSLVQRLALAVPYCLLGISLFSIGVFITRSVSHPVAGLVVGVPGFAISLLVFWLVAGLLNKKSR